MSKRILSISYDETLLKTRELILKGEGFTVTRCWVSRNHCKRARTPQTLTSSSSAIQLCTQTKWHSLRSSERIVPRPFFQLSDFLKSRWKVWTPTWVRRTDQRHF